MSATRVAHVTTVDLTLRYLLLGQLTRLRDEGFDVTAISAPGPWVEDLRTEGIRHVEWSNATRAWNPGADARAFAELLGIFRRERFDLVHTHNPKPGVLGRVAARAAGIPCVVNTVHGFYATPEDRLAKRLVVLGMERAAAWFSDLELFQSEEDLAWARRIGLVAPSRAVLLGNGTDVTRFSPAAVPPERVTEIRGELGLPPDAVVVGAVGRLVAEKGYLELFEAARRVRASHPEVRFVAVGGGDPDKGDAVSRRAMDAASADVVFTGWRDDVRDLMGAMDVFVLPSWREGVPRSAIEAAALGIPMVLTDIRGCREVARDGEEAILVPPRDADALTEAVGRLVASPALRERLGQAARRRAKERFDERRVTDIVVASYRRLLSEKGIAASIVGAGNGAPTIRRARPGDAAAMARIHTDALPDAFLPSLGMRFLTRLYRSIATDPGSVAYVADGGGAVVGFAAATVSVAALYRRFLRRNGLRAALDVAPRLARPSVLRRVLETVSYPTQNANLPDTELLSIAVRPGQSSKGVGSLLVRRTIDELGERGAGAVKVLVAATNDGANRFYERQGFRLGGRIDLHAGASSNVWVIRCHSSSQSA